MKRIVPILVLSVFLNGCRNDDNPDLKKSSNPIQLTMSKDEQLFPTLKVANGRARMGNLLTRKMNVDPEITYRELDERVMQTSDLTLLLSRPKTQGITNGVDNIEEHYKKVAKTFENDVLALSRFRTRYAAAIIKNRMLLTSNQFENLAFYTNELIDSQMGSYELIISCLKRLKGHIETSEFQKSKSKTLSQIEQSVTNEQKLQKELANIIIEQEKIEKEYFKNGETGTRPKRVFLETARQMLKLGRPETLEKHLLAIQAL